MFRTSLRNLAAHKLRLMLTCLAIVFGVAFTSGVMVFGDSVSRAFTDSSAQDYDNVSVAVQATADSRDEGRLPRLDQALLDKVRALPGVDYARGQVGGFTGVVNRKGDIVGNDSNDHGTNFSPGPNGSDPDYTFVQGRPPTTAGEVAIDAGAAKKAGYRVGDRIRVVADGPVMDVTLVGVFDTDDGRVDRGGTLTVFDTATAQRMFSLPDRYTEITLKARPGVTQTRLLDEVRPLVPAGAKATTGARLTKENKDDIERATGALSKALLVFAGIALFVGTFIIANTFTMLVAQRTREIALLRAVGATRGQVVRSVRVEAAVIGLIGSVVGLLLGIALAAGLHGVLNATGAELPAGGLVIAPMTVFWALLVGVGVTVVAAWLPARKAARVPPVAALRADIPQTTASLRRRNIVGVLITLFGVAQMILSGQSEGSGEAKLLGILAGAVVTLIGVIVLTPLLAGPAINLAGAVFGRLFGVEGRLARLNAARNPRRTAATASALMIGLVLVTGLSVFGASLKDMLDRVALKGITADYAIGSVSGRPISPEVAATVAKVPDVAAYSPLRRTELTLDGREQAVTALDEKGAFEVFNVDFSQGGPAGLVDGLLVSKDEAKERHWKPGSRVTVVYPDDTRAVLPVGGIYDNAELLGNVVVSTQKIAPHVDRVTDSQVLVTAKRGTEGRLKGELEAALGDNPALRIQTKDDLRRELGGIIDLLLNVLYGLLGMAIVIAIIGIVNTLAMSVFERTREIGMLRAIGLDRRRVRRMIRLESLAISLFGASLGIVLGLLAGAFGIRSIQGDTPELSIVIPWGRIALFLVLAAIVGVFAAWWPARRAAGLDVLEALHTE